MKAHAVIGANYGDEGKGLIVDYLCNSPGRTLVIRFNGGAQSGHTVVLPDGERHVFGHLGSGSFSGCPTFFSKFFIMHPMLFKRELQAFKEKYLSAWSSLTSTVGLFADPWCLITTPYDVMLNQVIEDARGDDRYGSTGTGVSETVERSMHKEYKLMLGEIFSDQELTKKLDDIRKQYVPERLMQERVSLDAFPLIKQVMESDEILSNFIDDYRFLLNNIAVIPTSGQFIIRSFDYVIFEGAQGLMLDWVKGEWPYVTRSNTGIRNVLELCSEIGIKEVEAIYVTRPYVTRHGAGPLYDEISPVGVDETNVLHPYQGELRYGALDVGELRHRIFTDLREQHPDSAVIYPTLAVTCTDHADLDKIPLYMYGGEIPDEELTSENIGTVISKAVGINGSHIESRGPTVADVTVIDDEYGEIYSQEPDFVI